jgi:hypothetical protein
MGFKITGNAGTDAEVDGTTFRAVRITQRPVEYGALGAYTASALSGTMAAGLAAASEIVQMRWTDATRYALIYRITLDGMAGSATSFTAGFANIQAMIARGWTADGSGGTALTVTGNNQKLRTSMGTTLIGALRASSTAALTAGTKTLDANPIGQIAFSVGTAASVIYVNRTTLYGAQEVGAHPIVLASNEGVIVRATVPATGTWQFGVTIDWAEVSAF